MSDLVRALCNGCGRVRTVDPYCGERGDHRCVVRRCRTCRARTSHAWLAPSDYAGYLDEAEDERRDDQVAAASQFERSAEQLRSMGVGVFLPERMAKTGAAGMVVRDFDRDGRFSVFVDGQLDGHARGMVLRTAVDIILDHDKRGWLVGSTDPGGVAADPSFGYLAIVKRS